MIGATGLLGRDVLKYFKDKPDWDCIGLSRRDPQLSGVMHLKSDLMDKKSIDDHANIFTSVTHVVYGALYEMDELISGWRHKQQIEYNSIMFTNFIESLTEFAANLNRHRISVLQF